MSFSLPRVKKTEITWLACRASEDEAITDLRWLASISTAGCRLGWVGRQDCCHEYASGGADERGLAGRERWWALRWRAVGRLVLVTPLLPVGTDTRDNETMGA